MRYLLLLCLPLLFACQSNDASHADQRDIAPETSSVAPVRSELWWRQPYTEETRRGSEWDRFVGPAPAEDPADEDLEYFEDHHFRSPEKPPTTRPPTPAPAPAPQQPEKPSEDLEEADESFGHEYY